MEKNGKKKSFWETLKFWKKENPKVKHKVKRMTVMLISRYAFHPEFLYRPAIIDFNQKKVGVFNKTPQLVNGENQYNGFVVGALENSGQYVYLAAFESGLNCYDYQRVCLDEGVEDLAFHISKSVYETFSSNFRNSDLKHKLAYCDNTYSSVPDEEDLVLANERPLTFRKAKYEELLVKSYSSKMWLWVIFDAEGNILNPHEYVSWKPYEYILKYEYVSASGKYLYQDCDYIVSDLAFYLKKKYPDYCGVIRNKETGDLGYLGCDEDYSSNMNKEELELLLKDKEVAKKLEGKRVRGWDTDERFVIFHGELLEKSHCRCDTRFKYCNLKGDEVSYYGYELVDPYNDTKYFVCGMMRQISSAKTFYLAMCNGKYAENYFDLSKAELKTLLKDDIVATVLEGKSFMVSEKGGKCYQISNRKLHPIDDCDDSTHFILRDENCITLEEKYNSSDWELVEPESYVKPPSIFRYVFGKIKHEKSGEKYYLKMLFDDNKCNQKEIFKEYDGFGLLLSLEELQKLLKNEKVATVLEGKSFWSYKASDENHKFIEPYEVSKGELKRCKQMAAQGNYFQIINEKGFIVTKDFIPSEWKVVEPQAAETA